MFLKPSMQLQTTRSPRLLNGFCCFLVQNEEEVLLVSFLFSTAHFCWVENDENFDSSKKVSFVQVFFTNVGVSAELECQQKILENPGNNAYCRIRPPQTFLYLPKPTPHQISRQTEHLAMCTSRARKCRRNEPTYRGPPPDPTGGGGTGGHGELRRVITTTAANAGRVSRGNGRPEFETEQIYILLAEELGA